MKLDAEVMPKANFDTLKPPKSVLENVELMPDQMKANPAVLHAGNKLTHFRVVFSIATIAGPQHVRNVHSDSDSFHDRCRFANTNSRCAQSIVFLYHILTYLNSYLANMHIHVTNPQIPVKNTD